MFSTLFWKDAAERFIKTFAQALLAIVVVAPQTPFLAFDWPSAIGLAVTAAFISLLTSIASGVVTGNTKTVSPASAAPDSRGI